MRYGFDCDMKLKKLVYLGFSSIKLEDSCWQELDGLTDVRVLVADESEQRQYRT